MQRRIRKLENAPRLVASNIQTNGNSRLSVSNVNGQIVHQAGDLAGSTPGTVVSGIAVYRPSSGTAAFTAASGAQAQYGFNDQTGQAIIQTDEGSGYGLQDPTIPITMYANVAAAIPSTTSGGSPGTLMWIGNFNCTHPFLNVAFQAAVSGGATGTITLQVNGATVGTATATAAGFTTLAINNISAVGSNVKTNLSIALYGAITSGTGTLQVLMQHARLHGSLG